MTPGPKLVHAIQHQIFKEKKKKIARPHQFPTMVARESRIFFGLALVWFTQWADQNENEEKEISCNSYPCLYLSFIYHGTVVVVPVFRVSQIRAIVVWLEFFPTWRF